MTQVQPILAQIASRSLEDDDFRARLIADARATLESDLGLMFPEDVEIDIVENSRTKYTIVLPPADQAADEEDDVVGFGIMYHDPAHNFSVNVNPDGIQRPAPGNLGFGSNPFKTPGK